MENITVTPSKIRGGGDLLDDKDVNSFLYSKCSIETSRKSVNGVSLPIYTLNSYFDNIGKFLRDICGINSIIKTISVTGDIIQYTTLTITENITLGDLSGAVKNLRIDGDVIQYDTFSHSGSASKKSFTDADAENLIGILTSLTYENDVISFTKIERGDI